jgi:hypothetical protein
MIDGQPLWRDEAHPRRVQKRSIQRRVFTRESQPPGREHFRRKCNMLGSHAFRSLLRSGLRSEKLSYVCIAPVQGRPMSTSQT